MAPMRLCLKPPPGKGTVSYPGAAEYSEFFCGPLMTGASAAGIFGTIASKGFFFSGSAEGGSSPSDSTQGLTTEAGTAIESGKSLLGGEG